MVTIRFPIQEIQHAIQEIPIRVIRLLDGYANDLTTILSEPNGITPRGAHGSLKKSWRKVGPNEITGRMEAAVESRLSYAQEIDEEERYHVPRSQLGKESFKDPKYSKAGQGMIRPRRSSMQSTDEHRYWKGLYRAKKFDMGEYYATNYTTIARQEAEEDELQNELIDIFRDLLNL